MAETYPKNYLKPYDICTPCGGYNLNLFSDQCDYQERASTNRFDNNYKVKYDENQLKFKDMENTMYNNHQYFAHIVSKFSNLHYYDNSHTSYAKISQTKISQNQNENKQFCKNKQPKLWSNNHEHNISNNLGGYLKHPMYSHFSNNLGGNLQNTSDANYKFTFSATKYSSI